MPLTPLELSLIASATTAIDVVPRSTPHRIITDHTVGSAILSSTGQIYTGINVYHFSGGPCAENVAFANAVAGGVSSATAPGVIEEGKKEAPKAVLIVAVANDGRGVINPCGRCRQMMMDFYPGIRVIIRDGEELRTAGMEELLPFSFVWGFRGVATK